MQCWKFEGEFAWMTIKHNFYPFCSSRENVLQRFLMPCVIDPLKALLHWDVIVLMDRWALMMWFSPAVVKRWPAFICTRGSNAMTDVELYVLLHQRRTILVQSDQRLSCVFHFINRFWMLELLVCLIRSAGVCVFGRLYTTWLKNFSSDFWCLYFQQSFIHHQIKYIHY